MDWSRAAPATIAATGLMLLIIRAVQAGANDTIVAALLMADGIAWGVAATLHVVRQHDRDHHDHGDHPL
jgi:hypothetical protein